MPHRDEIRVRFAPSPTGYLHLGGVRTALFNWLFARHHGGKFIFRIEDTDRTRSTDEYIQAILEGMEWLRMNWDEGPYRQTDRMEVYREHARRLLDEGKAYPCYCSLDELEEKRREAQRHGDTPKYDGTCREGAKAISGRPPVIRFKSLQEGRTGFDDLIRGPIEVDNAQLDDLILVRSDGSPTYNFTVVVDDVTMAITQVIRGDDHIGNTFRQIQLYRALGYSMPAFAHLPMILGPDRARLSKRHGAESILVYRQWGYLPEAMINYLARLGWSHGDQEIFSVEELINLFDLDQVNKAAAVFDPNKLLWVNSQHMKSCDRARLARLLGGALRKSPILPSGQEVSGETLRRIADCLVERSKTLVEMADSAHYFIEEEITYAPEAAAKFLGPEILPILEELVSTLEAGEELEVSVLESIFKALMEQNGVKLVKIAQPVRVALTGGTASPGLFEVMSILGKDKVVRRLKAAISYISRRLKAEEEKKAEG